MRKWIAVPVLCVALAVAAPFVSYAQDSKPDKTGTWELFLGAGASWSVSDNLDTLFEDFFGVGPGSPVVDFDADFETGMTIVARLQRWVHQYVFCGLDLSYNDHDVDVQANIQGFGFISGKGYQPNSIPLSGDVDVVSLQLAPVIGFEYENEVLTPYAAIGPSIVFLDVDTSFGGSESSVEAGFLGLIGVKKAIRGVNLFTEFRLQDYSADFSNSAFDLADIDGLDLTTTSLVAGISFPFGAPKQVEVPE